VDWYRDSGGLSTAWVQPVKPATLETIRRSNDTRMDIRFLSNRLTSVFQVKPILTLLIGQAE
jgi:hypothetical protein